MVAGDQGANPSDSVIPNGADVQFGAQNAPLNTVLENGFTIGNFPAPFAGTEPLIKAFNAVPASQPIDDGDASVLATRFSTGTHRTPVNADKPAVFNELVNQLTVFFNQKGVTTQSLIADETVIAQ